jgi:hypothetical protein
MGWATFWAIFSQTHPVTLLQNHRRREKLGTTEPFGSSSKFQIWNSNNGRIIKCWISTHGHKAAKISALGPIQRLKSPSAANSNNCTYITV